jgi:hypothetical protein
MTFAKSRCAMALRARSLYEWRFQRLPQMDLKASIDCKCADDTMAAKLC